MKGRNNKSKEFGFLSNYRTISLIYTTSLYILGFFYIHFLLCL